MAKNNRLSTRTWLLLFWLASAVALAGALISQFVFDLHPCHLCLYQRVPYSTVLLLLTPLIFYKKIDAGRIKFIFLLLALLFMCDAVIAGYHAGVEKKWWPGPTDCTAGESPNTIEELTASIMKAAVVPCDQPAFVFLGLSMAGWNMFYALGLAGVALWRSRN